MSDSNYYLNLCVSDSSVSDFLSLFLDKNREINIVNNLTIVTQHEFITNYIPNLSINLQKSNVTILLDISSRDAIDSMIHFVRKTIPISKSILANLKVIVLSTVLTWAGKSYKNLKLIDVDKDFVNRVPIMTSMDFYLLENCLYELFKECKDFLKLMVIGCGLIYGGKKSCLSEIFRNIWSIEGEVILIPSDSDSNRVPMIHETTFISLVTSLFQPIVTDHQTFYLVACEQCKTSIASLVSQMEQHLNPGSSRGISFCRSQSEQLQSLLLLSHPNLIPSDQDVNRQYVWTCDLPFAQHISINSLSNDIMSSLDDQWQEFLHLQHLHPLQVAVAGPPRSGKTSLCQWLSTSLQIPVVDVMSSVVFCFSLNIDDANLTIPTWMNRDKICNLRLDIIKAIEEKNNEGTKKTKTDKDKTTSDRPVVDVSDLTESNCQSLSLSLLKRCVIVQLCFDPLCVRKGFVLDLWQKEGMFQDGLDSFVEEIKMNDEQQQHISWLSWIIELQISSSVLQDRLSQSLGGSQQALKNKESQNILKNYETQLTTYSSGLDEEGRLKIVSSMVSDGSLLKGGCLVCQDGGELEGNSKEEVLEKLLNRNKPLESFIDVQSDDVIVSVVNESELLPSNSNLPIMEELLSNLSDINKCKLVNKSEKLLSFLTTTLLPTISEGLVKINRDRPVDPIHFLADFLLSASQETRDNQCVMAMNRFSELLQ